MCNVFKPERSHHCSACNRCVLNMDHHCLWLNNCVGFWNRKHFMLTIVYAQTITLLIEFTLCYDFYLALSWGLQQKFMDPRDKTFWKNFIVLLAFTLNTLLCLLLSAFSKFHWRLATENKTTIENLEHNQKPYESQYDIGLKENLYQIFGSNFWLALLPIHCSGGIPHGDGVIFPKSKKSLMAQKKPPLPVQKAAPSPSKLHLSHLQASTAATPYTSADFNQDYFAVG